MKKAPFAAALAVVAALMAGCASYPAQVMLEPARFENDALQVEWAIGINFFRLKVTNLTDAQVDLDLAGSAVVSVDGEARVLAGLVQRDAAFVPPHAYIVLSSPRGAIFGTDILGRFNAETEDRYALPLNTSADDRVFLKGHSGETLRLYLAATARGKKSVLDLPFRITGATRVQSVRPQAP